MPAKSMPTQVSRRQMCLSIAMPGDKLVFNAQLMDQKQWARNRTRLEREG